MYVLPVVLRILAEEVCVKENPGWLMDMYSTRPSTTPHAVKLEALPFEPSNH